jgi:hypothetical protein
MLLRDKKRRLLERVLEAQMPGLFGSLDPDPAGQAQLKKETIDGLMARMDRFCDAYMSRFGVRPDPFAVFEDDTFRLSHSAFFDYDTLYASPEVQVAIWRILEGWGIQSLSVKIEGGKLELAIVLRNSDGSLESYAGGQGDFRVVKHFVPTMSFSGNRDAQPGAADEYADATVRLLGYFGFAESNQVLETEQN